MYLWSLPSVFPCCLPYFADPKSILHYCRSRGPAYTRGSTSLNSRESVRRLYGQRSYSSVLLLYPSPSPPVSGVQVGGQKMYQLAREGQSLDLPPRPVTISSLRVWRSEGNPQDVHFYVACSKASTTWRGGWRGAGGVPGRSVMHAPFRRTWLCRPLLSAFPDLGHAWGGVDNETETSK